MNPAAPQPPAAAAAPQIEVRGLHMAYGDYVVMRDLNFTIGRGEVFIIMGGSGTGKSTLLKHMIGLLEPAAGDILYQGESFTAAGERRRLEMLRAFGVMYQGGALWSSMTLRENVGLPLEQYTRLKASEIREVADYKLSLVGLAGYGDFYPAEISGGMRKRASLARAIALDPEILFFDEPSAGLDPITSRRLDELILQMSDSLGTTIVVVTHELSSIFEIGDNAIFLDREAKTITARGNPRALRDAPPNEQVRAFLHRLAPPKQATRTPFAPTRPGAATRPPARSPGDQP